jgi:small subunit ribosomal protein S1
VLDVDRDRQRISLGLKQTQADPWQRVLESYQQGDVVHGRATKVVTFGAFVEILQGVEGLVHISELATRRIRSVADVVKEGEQVECRVLAIDPHEQKLALSIKALDPPPAAKHAAGEPEPEAQQAEPEAPPPPRKQRTTPLKGGVGGESDGARFGLKW